MSILWCVSGGLSMSYLLILTAMSGLGWFAPHCDGGILHDGSSEGCKNIVVYEYRPLLRHLCICQPRTQRSDCRVHCCVRHS